MDDDARTNQTPQDEKYQDQTVGIALIAGTLQCAPDAMQILGVVADLRSRCLQAERARDELLEEMARGARPERVAEAVLELEQPQDPGCKWVGGAACDIHDSSCDYEDGNYIPASSACESLHAAVVTSPRDWSVSQSDAWIYGIVVGWDHDTMIEISSKFGWTVEVTQRLADIHQAMAELLEASAE